MKSFKLSDKIHRIEFAQELYNFSSDLQKDKENEDAHGKITELATSLKDAHFPAFFGKVDRNLKRRDPPSGGETQPKHKDYQGGVGNTLEAYGDGDIFEVDESTKELLSKVHVI